MCFIDEYDLCGNFSHAFFIGETSWAATHEYETPRTMKTNFIDKTIKLVSCA